MELQTVEETKSKISTVRVGISTYSVTYTVLLAPNTEIKCKIPKIRNRNLDCPNPIHGLMSVKSINIIRISKKFDLRNLVKEKKLYSEIALILKKREEQKIGESKILELCKKHFEELNTHPLWRGIKREPFVKTS